MKALIIDDDADIRFITGLSLERVGLMEVVQASGGEEGVRKAREWNPDVILLDMMMPVMDGTATLMALRAHPITANIPVIFLTAKTVKAEIDSMLESGALGVLIKPFNPRTLPADVRALLAHAIQTSDSGRREPLPLHLTPAALAPEKVDHTHDSASGRQLPVSNILEHAVHGKPQKV
jgi:DNA-binding response OmpR family regulator